MKTISCGLAMAAFCLFAVPCMAMPGMQQQSGDQKELEEQAKKNATMFYEKADTNKDGKLSKEEFLKALPNMKEQAFTVIDTDKNGSISLDEWISFTVRHAQGKQPMGTDHKPDVKEPLPTVSAPEPPKSSN